MKRKILYSFLLILILVDTTYSFMQHYHQPLDGDMSESIIPSNNVEKLFKDPFGIKLITSNEKNINPNRFFCHWIYNKYFRTMPFILQKFTNPIDSIYLSSAIAKILIQISLLILLSSLASGTTNLLKVDFLIVAIIITPFFQINGYSYMRIIDPSITYTFFYALPCIFIIVYFYPFISEHLENRKTYSLKYFKLLWIPFSVVVCFSGALNPGIALVFIGIILFRNLKLNYSLSLKKKFISRFLESIKLIPNDYWFYFIPIGIFSLYSLYLNRFNINNIHVSLLKLYSLMPSGIYYQFTQKLGFPVLFCILILNSILILKKYNSEKGKKIIGVLNGIILFAIIYILLLPLGGYRLCRSYLLRYDTIMPITLALVFIFGASTFFLLKEMSKKNLIWYLPIIIGVMLIYTFADKPGFDNNLCEKKALEKISNSSEKVVKLNSDCSVISWYTVLKPDDSEPGAQLLYFWKIVPEKKLYYYNNAVIQNKY